VEQVLHIHHEFFVSFIVIVFHYIMILGVGKIVVVFKTILILQIVLIFDTIYLLFE